MYLAKKVKAIDVIGPVLICYGIGLLLGNAIPLEWPKEFLDKNVNGVAVTLAIPLLMFHSNPARWMSLAGKAVLSFFLGALAVSVAVVIAYFLVGDQLAFGREMSAMMVGVYTGGTPNLLAIGQALQVPSETKSTLIIMDTVLCAVYLLFLLTIANRVLSLFLPQSVVGEKAEVALEEKPIPLWASIALPLLLTASCLLVGLGVSHFLWGKEETVTILLSLTLCAFGLSFLPRVNALSKSYVLGEYFILVFCISIGILSDLSILKGQDSSIMAFCAIIVVGSIALHFFLAYLFKIDVHTVLITSTAALFGPAFVGLMASRLKNPSIIASGMTTGVIGYVIANFLGFSIFKLLSFW